MNYKSSPAARLFCIYLLHLVTITIDTIIIVFTIVIILDVVAARVWERKGYKLCIKTRSTVYVGHHGEPAYHRKRTLAVDLQVDVLVDSDSVPLERLAPLDGSLEVLYGLVGGGVPLLGYLE